METKPLWPDGLNEHHYTCWNCGKRSLHSYDGSSSRFLCECGCGWSIRWDVADSKTERSMKEMRDTNFARAYGARLVDFTKPGAPSAPA